MTEKKCKNCKTTLKQFLTTSAIHCEKCGFIMFDNKLAKENHRNHRAKTVKTLTTTKYREEE